MPTKLDPGRCQRCTLHVASATATTLSPRCCLAPRRDGAFDRDRYRSQDRKLSLMRPTMALLGPSTATQSETAQEADTRKQEPVQDRRRADLVGGYAKYPAGATNSRPTGC